jgi:hypothetical protein
MFEVFVTPAVSAAGERNGLLAVLLVIANVITESLDDSVADDLLVGDPMRTHRSFARRCDIFRTRLFQ